MILLPEWLNASPPRPLSRRTATGGGESTPPATGTATTTLLANESLAVRDLLRAGERVTGAIRGADADEVYLWLVTPGRVLQLLHGRCQVALFRIIARRDLRALHLRVHGDTATIELTTRRRRYALHRVPVETALTFAEQLGVETVLTAERVNDRTAGA